MNNLNNDYTSAVPKLIKPQSINVIQLLDFNDTKDLKEITLSFARPGYMHSAKHWYFRKQKNHLSIIQLNFRDIVDTPSCLVAINIADSFYINLFEESFNTSLNAILKNKKPTKNYNFTTLSLLPISKCAGGIWNGKISLAYTEKKKRCFENIKGYLKNYEVYHNSTNILFDEDDSIVREIYDQFSLLLNKVDFTNIDCNKCYDLFAKMNNNEVDIIPASLECIVKNISYEEQEKLKNKRKTKRKL